jgi:hypothetical protein
MPGVGGAGGSDGDGGSAGDAGRGGSGATGGGTVVDGSVGASGSAGADAGRPDADGGELSCSPLSTDDACESCAKLECCEEYRACPRDQDCPSELRCTRECVRLVVADGGVASDLVFGTCAAQCAEGSTITDATNDVLACLYRGVRADGGEGQDCFIECFDGG